MVLPNPILTTTNITILPVCMGSDVAINFSGMVDGTYNLNYDLSGSNTLANQTATVIISGGNGSFTIPTAIVPNSGSTTIIFNSIQNATTSCQVALSNVNGTITIKVLAQIDATNIAVSSICIGSVATVVISNATNLPDGVYQFNYSIPTGTPATGNSGDVTITGGSGQFIISSSVFATIGSYTLTISGITTTTGCSNPTQNANISFTVVAPLSSGTFTGLTSVCPSIGVLDLAALLTGEITGGVWTDSALQVVTSPLNISNFAAGTYNYTYTVTNSCGTAFTPIQFTVLLNPQLIPLNISISSLCPGSNAIVNLTGMVDGTYTLNYNLTGSNVLANQSVVVTITASNGSFTIPMALIPNVGSTVISFTSIVNNASTCSNTLSNVTSNFTINPIPIVTGSSISAQATCPNFASLVTISGASSLTDGTYSITYQLTGANTSTTTILVNFTSGVATFTIPSTDLNNSGDTTITINQLISATTTCGITGNILSPTTFAVATLATPVLITDGNVFCDLPNPTIADLSANIVGTPNVLWYNAQTGGTTYSITDLLVDGTIYYVALVASSGCESARLPVKVSICTDVIIPDGFSPNNDGINDTFEIPNLSVLFPNFQLEIYNRYGNLVFNGDKNKANWGGTTTEGGLKLDNNLLPTGVYFYILNFNDGTRKAIQGSVYLNR